MTFEHLIETLQVRLGQQLPGREAQKLMAPFETDQRRFDLTERKGAKPGAVLLLFYPLSNDEIAFPLIQRPTYNGVHSGQIGFPGGKEEKEDNDLIETALRETQEEIGIDNRRVNILGPMTELYIPVSNFRVVPFVGYISEKPTFYPDNQEVKEVIEIKLSALMNDRNRKVKKVNVGPAVSLRAPYFDIGDRIVWGATAMMLSELVALLKS